MPIKPITAGRDADKNDPFATYRAYLDHLQPMPTRPRGHRAAPETHRSADRAAELADDAKRRPAQSTSEAKKQVHTTSSPHTFTAQFALVFVQSLAKFQALFRRRVAEPPKDPKRQATRQASRERPGTRKRRDADER